MPDHPEPLHDELPSPDFIDKFGRWLYTADTMRAFRRASPIPASEAVAELRAKLDIATYALDHYQHGGSEYRKIATDALEKIASPIPAGREAEERAAFEAYALEKKWAYRNEHGFWFYPARDGHEIWLGWQAARARIDREPMTDTEIDAIFKAEFGYRAMGADLLASRRFARRIAPSAREPMTWKPIETATGLGGNVLIASEAERWVCEGWFDHELKQWWAANNDSTDSHGGPLYPTHWIHLPPPPGISTPSKEVKDDR